MNATILKADGKRKRGGHKGSRSKRSEEEINSKGEDMIERRSHTETSAAPEGSKDPVFVELAFPLT